MSQEKQHTGNALIWFIAVFVLLFFLEYLLHNHFAGQTDNKIFSSIFEKIAAISSKMTLLRIFYLTLFFSFILLSPSHKMTKNMTEDDKTLYWVLCGVTSILIIVGYIHIWLYDVILFPILFFANMYISAKALSTIRKNFKDENVFGINQSEKGQCVFKLPLAKTEKFQYLVVPNANYGIINEGGTGCGKSQSIQKPLIEQAAENGYAGIVYDYNGNPNEESNPILTRVAYYGIKKGIEKAKHESKEFKTKLAFLNFNDLTKSVRINFLDKKYIHHKLDIINIATAMMKNLERTWKEKIDFWGQNAIQILTAAIHYFHKNYPEMCDLPHVVALLLSPHEKFLKLITSDDEIRRDFMPVYSAWVAKAEGQIAGAIASAQAPLSKLDNPQVFWVLSKSELDLDITNKENPTLLCLGNDPSLGEALSAVISAILLVVQTNMNKPGKVKSIFAVDEIPTILLYKIDEFISVCRKYFVCCIFGLQTQEQFSRDYGEKSANTIRNALGNFLFGSTGDIKTAEYFSNQIGTIKKIDVSYNDGDSSSSTGERMQNEKAIQPREVMSQPIGHFMGKILGGQPAYFSAQFDFFRPEEEDPDYLSKTDIRPFANYYNSGNKNRDYELFMNDVHANYARIYKDVNTLLDNANTEENLKKLFQNIYDSTKHLNDEEKSQLLNNMKEAMEIK